MKKNTPRSRSKRPTATLDLKAKEVKKDTADKEAEKSTSPDRKISSSSPRSSGQSKPSSNTKPAEKTDEKKQAPKSTGGKTPNKADELKKSTTSGPAKAPPTASSSRGGGFLSHLFTSIIAAGLGILGFSYAHQQNLLPASLRLNNDQAVKQQISALSGKIRMLEQTNSSTDQLASRLDGIGARLEKTEANLGAGAPGSLTLAQKVAKLETVLGNLESAAKTGKGGQLAGLTAVTKELNKSNKRSLTLETELVKMREAQSSFREDLAGIRSAQADFQTSSAKISDDLAKMRNSTAKIVADASRPPDVSAQISPVLAKLKELTGKIDGVVGREAGSRAEGRNIALALSLGELKRAVNQGTPYIDELERVRPHAPQNLDLAILAQHAEKGLVTRQALLSSFSSASHKALASEVSATSGSFVDQLLANAKSMVQVRPTGLVKGETTGAILSRMEYKLTRNDLAGGLKESAVLHGQAKQALQPWLDRARSRLTGDRVLRALEDKIRNALAGNVSQ